MEGGFEARALLYIPSKAPFDLHHRDGVGAVLKEGLVGFEEGHDKLLELVLAPSTDGAASTSLGDYVARMKEGQAAIYYVTAPTREGAERSPHLEAFRARGYEVLFFLDPIDELWLRLPREVDGKKLVSVAKEAVDLATEEERKGEEVAREETGERFKDLLLALRARLQDQVREVRLSGQLTESPACLVGETGDLSPHLEELVRRSGQDVPKVKRVLEINPAHPLVTGLQAFHAAHPADERFARLAELLYGQAILAEGGTLPDPAAFSLRLGELLALRQAARARSARFRSSVGHPDRAGRRGGRRREPPSRPSIRS